MAQIILRVANTTEAQSLATAIVKFHEEGKKVVLTCLGVVALGVAAKAVILSNEQMAREGFVLSCYLSYRDMLAIKPETEGEEVTVVAIRLQRQEVGSLWAAKHQEIRGNAESASLQMNFVKRSQLTPLASEEVGSHEWVAMKQTLSSQAFTSNTRTPPSQTA